MVRWCWVNFQCRGVLFIWIRVGQGPTALAVGAGGGCLDIFILIYPFSPLSPSLWETARYRLKYCLKGPLNQKQPTTKDGLGRHSMCNYGYVPLSHLGNIVMRNKNDKHRIRLLDNTNVLVLKNRARQKELGHGTHVRTTSVFGRIRLAVSCDMILCVKPFPI